MFPGELTGVTVLTNISQANTKNVAYSSKDILDGNLQQSYGLGLFHILDIAFTVFFVIVTPSAVMHLVLGLLSKNKPKVPITQKKYITTILWCLLGPAAIITVPLLIPGLGGGWWFIINVTSISFLAAPIAMTLYDCCSAWRKLSNSTIQKKETIK